MNRPFSISSGANRNAVQRRPITPYEKQLWAEMAQLLMLAGLAESSKWEAKDIVFHGGTSLHLGWASPRFSEDLDFLLNKDLLSEMNKTMHEVVKRMEHYLLRFDTGLRVELKDKSTSRMGRFNIAISKEGVMGKSLVKSEFWGVDAAYLDSYRSTSRTPIVPDSMSSQGMHVRLRAQLPVATLDSVFCDKLVAVAGRPYIKWRDIFDLWWISQSREFERPDPQTLAMRVREYASAYRTDPNTPEHDDTVPGEQPSFETSLAQRLRDYSDKLGQADMEHAAKEELQRFLTDISGSTAMWDRYWPDGIRHMIDHAREVASDAASTIEAMEEAERHDLRRHERTRMTI
ncbi:TPA: nucleotidyl transferase AbiEii/AbiGii toxin family protein [Streptococcus pneumoniae]|jgi:predicted nucleotidyltransferase component of viral defense system